MMNVLTCPVPRRCSMALLSKRSKAIIDDESDAEEDEPETSMGHVAMHIKRSVDEAYDEVFGERFGDENGSARVEARANVTSTFHDTKTHLQSSFRASANLPDPRVATVRFLDETIYPSASDLADIPRVVHLQHAGTTIHVLYAQMCVIWALATLPPQGIEIVINEGLATPSHSRSPNVSKPAVPITLKPVNGVGLHVRKIILPSGTGTGKTLMSTMALCLMVKNEFERFKDLHFWASDFAHNGCIDTSVFEPDLFVLLPIIIVSCPRSTMASWIETIRGCGAAFEQHIGFKVDVMPDDVSGMKVTQHIIERAYKADECSGALFMVVQSNEAAIIMDRLHKNRVLVFGLIDDEFASERVVTRNMPIPRILGVSATPLDIAHGLRGLSCENHWKIMLNNLLPWKSNTTPSIESLLSTRGGGHRYNQMVKSVTDVAKFMSANVAFKFLPYLLCSVIDHMPIGFYMIEHIVARSMSSLSSLVDRGDDPTVHMKLSDVCKMLQIDTFNDRDVRVMEIIESFNSRSNPLTNNSAARNAKDIIRSLHKKACDGKIKCCACLRFMPKTRPGGDGSPDGDEDGEMVVGTLPSTNHMLVMGCCTSFVCDACHHRWGGRCILNCAGSRNATTATITYDDGMNAAECADPHDAAPMPSNHADLVSGLKDLKISEDAMGALTRIVDMCEAAGETHIVIATRLTVRQLRPLERASRHLFPLDPGTSCRDGRRIVSDTIAHFNSKDGHRVKILIINNGTEGANQEVAGSNLPSAGVIIFTGTLHQTQIIGRIMRLGTMTNRTAKIVVNIRSTTLPLVEGENNVMDVLDATENMTDAIV